MDPWTLFIVTYVAAGSCGLADLLRSKTEPFTLKAAIGQILFFGVTGSALAMITYDYLDGPKYPWLVLGVGMLPALKVLRLEDIATIARKILGSGKDDNDKKD